MIKRFDSKRYKVEVHHSILNQRKAWFRMKAIHKRSKLCSWVTNMNWIISNIGEDDNPKFFESDWTGNKREAEQWFKGALEILQDEKSFHYLETLFDNDREAGEWENKGSRN
jgi:hypothetical protein